MNRSELLSLGSLRALCSGQQSRTQKEASRAATDLLPQRQGSFLSKKDGETAEKTSPSPASISQGDALTAMRPESNLAVELCARHFILFS